MSSKEISSARKIIARALLIASLPLVFLGLIDPLEGGIALLLSLLTLSAAFLAAGYWPKKALWVPFVLAIAVGAIALLVAIFGLDRANNQPSMIPLIALLWLYRIMVVVTLVGLVREVIRSFKSTTFNTSEANS
ncbi:MAG: hypothetical protein RIR89_162 [Actinomycetota bacterium]|jgi:hypothetical protein